MFGMQLMVLLINTNDLVSLKSHTSIIDTSADILPELGKFEDFRNCINDLEDGNPYCGPFTNTNHL